MLTCKLDAGEAEAYSSPWTINDLAAGPHTVQVTAIDSLGSKNLSPAGRSWTVNPSGPQATVTADPANPSPDGDAEFVFTGEGGAFECSLDSSDFADCVSPKIYTGLSAGDHTFLVRVTAGGGTATAHTWTMINVAPVALNQDVSAVENDADGEPITLTATDSGALTYRIVDQPQHGYLDGTPPTVTYVPFADYSGPDSFTFEADDGQSSSNVAPITVTVSTDDGGDGGDTAPQYTIFLLFVVRSGGSSAETDDGSVDKPEMEHQILLLLIYS